MKLKQRLDAMWGRQHQRPVGILGRMVGERMLRQHQPETDWTLDLLQIQPTDTILEVGFGAGRGIKLATEKAPAGHVMGIDLSKTMLQVATRRNAQAIRAGRVILKQGDIAALPFEDQQFDRIMTIHTFYFWSEPSLITQELLRVLKPAGRLVVTLATGKLNDQGVEEFSHLQTLLEEQVVPDMLRNGFKVVRLERGPFSRQYNNVALIGEK
ncbi:class I SAM-dependent methyltransferase [Ktedonobacter racemifer]|uniref:Methyltransferase type 11 n=1 Tax=Ktedonobacter racemifer DSM 44963 TaxID=485913 RepID=D6TTU1_KTERA|nr:class I SAM-dependent methyltransferase [Ktedonobacter racemifer]EFH83842.1 Methyltransferase type 11 [Ktedonobacter racemifer DSM 44963]